MGSFTVWLAEQFADSPLKEALKDGIRSLTAAYSLDKIPASKSADVYKFTYGDGQYKDVFYCKQYHCRSAWDFIKHAFRPSRAKRTIQAAVMLEANGFASPAIIAMGDRSKGPFCFENFLLTREVQDASPIYAFFPQHFSVPDRMQAKRDFIRALGHFVGRLHAANISHGDLRLGNILVRSSLNQQPAASNQQLVVDFFLLDNERTVKYARLPNRLRLKNLVQVNMYRHTGLSRTDRLRLFKAYLYENPHLASAWKTWAQKVARKTFRRLAKSANAPKQ
jgi:tRNA A-37 threonylcarbamoyl transferase component Bud32